MKIRQIRNHNLIQLTVLPHLFPINCYVWETTDSLIVIDMGTRQFVPALQRLSSQTHKPITQLWLTHAHTDHVGGVPAFHQAFPEARVGISDRDAALLRGDFSLQSSEPATPIKGGFAKVPILIDFTFHPGTTMAGWQVVATPGHTPGSVSFYQPDTGSLVVGDAWQTHGGLAVSGDLRWRFPFPALATWSPTLAVTSAQRLLDLHPQLLAVGHGNWLAAPVTKMARALKRAEAK